MQPVPPIQEIEPGDVLHHARSGYAVVEEVRPMHRPPELMLRWEATSAAGPDRVTARAVEHPDWAFCVPTGFLARSVREREALRAMVATEPVAAMRLLLDELDQPLHRDEVRRWLADRELVHASLFDLWWSALSARLPDASVHLDGDRIRFVPLDSAPDDVQRFLDAPPRRRFAMLSKLDLETLDRALDAALDAGDGAAVMLLLRTNLPLTGARAESAIDLGLTRHPQLGSMLIERALPAAIQRALDLLAASDAETGPVSSALATLPPRRRAPVVLDLLERGLAQNLPSIAISRLAQHLPGGRSQGLYALRREHGKRWLDQVARKRWPRAMRWIENQTASTTLDRPPVAQDHLLERLGPIDPERLLGLSVALARALAERHANGQSGGIPGARLAPDGHIVLGPPEDTRRGELGSSEDVRQAMRLLLERVIGTLPRSPELDDQDLLAHIAALVPDLSPDWLAVATRALHPDPAARIPNPLALWTELEIARATDRVRRSTGERNRARLDVGHDTHIGLLKSRLGQVNQDAVFWDCRDDLALLVLADGISVSTAGSGNLASAIAVQEFAKRWHWDFKRLRSAPEPELTRFLVDALAGANTAVCNGALRLAGGDLSRHIPMGTTVVAALFRRGRAWLASVGDSRIYLVGRSGASQLTGDQNVRGAWLKSWQQGKPMDLPSEGPALVGYCGHFDEEGRPEAIPPQLRGVDLLPGEVLALCTDGVTDYVADTASAVAERIAQAASIEDLDAACRYLTDLANAGGGGDNISSILARCREE